jgi:2-methylcitrate dehydratase PrpD
LVETGVQPHAIDRVELGMNGHPMTRQQASDADRRIPASRETADHSYYFMTAVALLRRSLSKSKSRPI